MVGHLTRRARFLIFVSLVAFLYLSAVHSCLRAQPPRGKDIYQDFRGSKPLTDEWKMIGQNREAKVQPEDGGLRITLPKTPKSTQPVGVRLMFPLSGDFEITCAYQFLAADSPPPGALGFGGGVGVAFNLVAQNDHKKFVRFGRFLFAPEGNLYVAECRLKDSPKDYQMKTAPTDARSGKLRLVREGSKLRYLVADNPPEVFREIHSGVFTDEDLEIVRIGVNNNNSPAGIDVRLVDIRIRFGNRHADQADAPDEPAESPARPFSRAWLVVALLLGITIILIFAAVGLYVVMRRRRRAPETPVTGHATDEAEKQSASSLSAQCPGCGKNLKFKAESAGKKIKCSHCGKVILAPTL